MMRTLRLALVILMAFSAPAWASGGGEHGKEKENKGPTNRFKAEWTIKNDVFSENTRPKPSETAHAVDIPVVVAPISVDGRLVNYAFLNIRVVLHDKVDVWKMRSQSHFMRDAVIRAAHTQSFGKKGERSLVDEERVIGLIRTAILPWVSEVQLEHIEFFSIDMLNG